MEMNCLELHLEASSLYDGSASIEYENLIKSHKKHNNLQFLLGKPGMKKMIFLQTFKQQKVCACICCFLGETKNRGK